MSKLGPKCQYFLWPPLFSSTALTLLGMEFTRASQVATGVLFHFSMTTSLSWWMLETVRSSTFRLMVPHRCSIGFRSGDMLGPSITFTLNFFSKAVVVVMLDTALGPSLWREGIMLRFRMSQYMLEFMVSSMNCSSPVPAALMQPQTMTLPPLCLTVSDHTPHTASNWSAWLLSPSGTTAMQTNLMQCAVYGLSTDRLTPHPFNLCSNAGSTYASISQTQLLDMTEHWHSTLLVDHGEAYSEWNLSC